MAVMSVTHPDILEFIHIKDTVTKTKRGKIKEILKDGTVRTTVVDVEIEEETTLTNFNISVGVTDEFIRKVDSNDPSPWKCDWKGTKYNPRRITRDSRGRVKKIEEVVMTAREIFDEIKKSAHGTGDPGVVFLDTVNFANPMPGLGRIECSNPCFHGGTFILVKTFEGPSVMMIRDITEPTLVYSLDLKTGKVVEKWASAAFMTKSGADTIVLTTDAGDKLTVTPDHKVLVHKNHVNDPKIYCSKFFDHSEWVMARDVRIGDKLIRTRERYSLDIELSEVVKIQKGEPTDVYDIRVEDTHCVFADQICAHNCGEQFLHSGDVCNLGSTNEEAFVNKNTMEIDFKRRKYVVGMAVRMLDNVIDITESPIKRVREVSRLTRRVGLGTMGLAGALCKAMIGYNTERGFETAEKLAKQSQDEGWRISYALGRLKGPFPGHKLSKFSNEEHPPRNVAVTNVPPTGTTALIFNVPNGIEPYFSLAYTRIVRDSALNYMNEYLEEKLKAAGISDQSVFSKIYAEGSVQNIPEIPQEIKDVFVGAMDIKPEDHIRMQATFQKHTDNAISKCVVEGSYVPTSDGPMRIEELGQAEIGEFGKARDVQIIGSDGLKYNVKSFYNNGESNTIQIKLENGAVIEATPKHKIMTDSGEWVSLEDIQVGGAVVCRFTESHGKSGGKIEVSSKEQEYLLENMPTNLTVELAEWIGIVSNYGYFSTGFLVVGSPHAKNRYKTLTQNIFGVDPVFNGVGLLIKGIVVGWVRSILCTHGETRNAIPEFIMRGSKDEKIAFLSGYCIFNRYYYNLVPNGEMFLGQALSQEYTYRLCTLCRSFGLPFVRVEFFGTSDVPRYNVIVTDELRDAITGDNRHFFKPSQWSVRTPKTHKVFCEYEGKRVPWYTISKSVLDELKVEYDHSEYVTYVKEKTFNDTPKRTFDIEVESPDHSYVMSDIVTHNTINFPESGTLEDIEKGYMMAWKLGCKGTTVYRDKCRSFQVLNVGVQEEPKSAVVPSTSSDDTNSNSDESVEETAIDDETLLFEGVELIKHSNKSDQSDLLARNHCPACQSPGLRRSEGCKICDNCKWSACSL